MRARKKSKAPPTHAIVEGCCLCSDEIYSVVAADPPVARPAPPAGVVAVVIIIIVIIRVTDEKEAVVAMVASSGEVGSGDSATDIRVPVEVRRTHGVAARHASHSTVHAAGPYEGLEAVVAARWVYRPRSSGAATAAQAAVASASAPPAHIRRSFLDMVLSFVSEGIRPDRQGNRKCVLDQCRDQNHGITGGRAFCGPDERGIATVNHILTRERPETSVPPGTAREGKRMLRAAAAPLSGLG